MHRLALALCCSVFALTLVPLEVRGTSTTLLQEQIHSAPPESLPSVHLAPPLVKPDSTIVIELDRSACLGSCPAYSVILNSDGSVVFDGEYFVRSAGKHTSSVHPADVRKLAEKFVKAEFYSMEPKYVGPVTDFPTYVLSITIDGQAKKVTDYAGRSVGMPAVINDLEDDVDRLAQTRRWIR